MTYSFQPQPDFFNITKPFTARLCALLLVAITAFGLATAPSHAQSAAEKAAAAEVTKLLKAAHRGGGSLGALRSAVSRHFAVRTWTNAALGKNRAKLSSGQKSELNRLFPSYIAKQYFKQFGGKGPKAGTVTKTRVVRRDVLVTSRIPSARRTFTVVWRMRAIGGRYRVIDYSAGGVSSVVLRRSEFRATIQKSGGAGLIKSVKSFIAS